ncbi:MAG: hypothetical protein S4CHLAM27_00950 [Chlamydiia bacterium]|nr:hypothetical protein [Chlamydiia bacterium]
MSGISGNVGTADGGGLKIDGTAQDELNKGVQRDRATEQQSNRATEQQVTALAQERIQAQVSSAEREDQLFERVAGLVSIISRKSCQVKAWTEIAVFFSSINNSEKAKEALEKAQGCHTPYSGQCDEGLPGGLVAVGHELGYIAEAQAATGCKEVAIQTINTINPDQRFIQGRYLRVKLKAEIGDIGGCQKERDLLTSPAKKKQCLPVIVRGQIKKGDTQGAKETAGLISHSLFKSIAIRDIAMHLFKQYGDVNKLIDSVEKLPDIDEKNDALRQVIRILAESNKIKRAKQVLAQIKDKQVRVYSEIAIAEFHEESGDIKRITGIATKAFMETYIKFRVSVLKVQLKRKIKSGDIEAAKVLAKGCNQCSAKDEALLSVVQSCINSGNIKGADAMAEIILSGDAYEYTKDVALRLLAGAYARSGDFPKAREAINDISAAEERIKAEFEVYRIREEREKEDKAKILAAE